MDEFNKNTNQHDGEYHYSYLQGNKEPESREPVAPQEEKPAESFQAERYDNGSRPTSAYQQPRQQEPFYNRGFYAQPSGYTPTPQEPAQGQPKKKGNKKPKRYGVGSLVAVALCAAILCGGISSAGVAYFMQKNTPAPSVGDSSGSNASLTQTNQQINVIENADSVAKAAAQKASPSVVGIKVSTQSSQMFFGQSGSSVSEGSGVIYRADGYIITNYHVISAAVDNSSYGSIGKNAKIEVYLPSDVDTALSAEVIGFDASADLAVLKVDKTGLPAIEVGDSEKLEVGDTAIAIGNPGGLDFMGSVSKGIISGLNRSIVTENNVQMNLIQTDAAINPGNSGGALVDQNGKLIGINNSKMAGTDYEGMGFAIPVNEVVEICDRLINKENQPETYLGISVNTYYDSETLQRMGYPAGIVVYSVAAGSPAEEVGIQRNDIITKINGQAVTTYAAMISEKNKYNAGDTISITIYRGGKTADVQVTLGAAS